jgi:hypothetical protein
VLGAGANLIIRDLTEWPANHWAVHYPVAGHAAFGRDYLDLVDALLAKEYAWSIAQAHDALENYLRRIAATALLLDPSLLLNAWRSLRNNLGDRRRYPRTLAGWRARVAQSNPTVTGLLSFLRSWLPALALAERRNNREMPLDIWLLAAGHARRAIVHTAMLVENRALRKADRRTRTAFRTYFGGRRQAGGYLLTPTLDQAHEAIVNTAEYGLLVFKAASESINVEWRQVLPPK